MDGGNQPSGFFRLRNLAFLNLVFLFLLFLLKILLVSNNDFTSFLRVISPFARTLSLLLTQIPMCEEPVSTPMLTSCFVSPVAMVNWIVNGL